MQVRDLEHKPATTCTPATPLDEVARMMRKDNVGSVVVIDEHGAPAGIVTDRDIVVRAMAEQYGPATPVREVMTHGVTYLYDDADLLAAANELAGKGIRRLPVVDSAGHLTGLISFDDLIVAFADQIGRLAMAVRKEMHPIASR